MLEGEEQVLEEDGRCGVAKEKPLLVGAVAGEDGDWTAARATVQSV